MTQPSEVKIVDCALCSGSGKIIGPTNVFNPSGIATCAACGGSGKVQMFMITAGSTVPYVGPTIVDLGTITDLKKRVEELETEVKQQKHVIDELQKDNTRLLEERRKVDERYMVEHFHRLLPAPVLPEPEVPSEDRVRLRLNLITEEFFELLEATFGVRPGELFECHRDDILEAIEKRPLEVNVVEFADACADIKYVLVGAELEFGIDGRPIFLGVHKANMNKIGGPKRADGKGLKPLGWQPFDVAAELRRQGWKGP